MYVKSVGRDARQRSSLGNELWPFKALRSWLWPDMLLCSLQPDTDPRPSTGSGYRTIIPI